MNFRFQSSLFRWLAFVSVVVALAVSSGIMPTGAIPVATPRPGASSIGDLPAPNPASGTLPYDSSLLLVLDDPISSTSSKANETVRAHLKDALILNNVTIADAGTPVEIRIQRAERGKAGDVYGYVDIYFMPMKLLDGKELPLRAPTSHLTVTTTAGHESTVQVENTVEDVFIPYAVLYQAFRKGRNFSLGAGSEIRARTAAALAIDKHGTVSMQTTLPVAMPETTPATSFVSLPYAVESSPHPENRHSKPAVWTPSPEPSLPPLPEVAPTYTPSPSASPSPGASVSPSATPTTRSTSSP